MDMGSCNNFVGTAAAEACRLRVLLVYNKIQTPITYGDHCHGSLSVVTHAPSHASMLRPASLAGPMLESTGVGQVS